MSAEPWLPKLSRSTSVYWLGHLGKRSSSYLDILRAEHKEQMRAYLDYEEIKLLEQGASCLKDRLLMRLLFHLGCRISEALALEVKDIDFTVGAVTIEHLKARTKLSCSHCGARLGKSHTFCSKCGAKVERAVANEQEHRRMRTLPLDRDTLEMLREYIRRGGPVQQKGKKLIFGINRHRAWQIIKECADRAS